ncbi:MAG: glycosyltransferase involved in cell wall biosynthesis [Porticoccaceae bacterium]|jgi:glycosyltransferase involved in cell wall biosynthesis
MSPSWAGWSVRGSDMQTERKTLPENTFWVIPSFNEGETLITVIENLFQQGVNPAYIVLVDDGSTRGVLIEHLQLPAASVLRHLVNIGQGAALQTGIDYAISAGAQYVVTFDADGQHRYDDARAMLDHLDKRQNLSCLIGSRFLGSTEGMPASRGFTLRLGILFTQFVTGYRFTDVHNGLRVFRARFFRDFRFMENRMEHASEILDHLSRHPSTFEEFPVTIEYSSYSLDKGQGSLNGVKIAFRTILSKFL